MKVTNPKWVKRANQWCVTTIEKNSSKTGSKHDFHQTQYWFSTKEEAVVKHNELTSLTHEPKNN